MKKFEISVYEYGTGYKTIMGIYEGETAFDAVKAYAKDAGLETPTQGGSGDYFEWGHEYTWDDVGDLSTYNAKASDVGHCEFNAEAVEVETADLEEFIVPDYQTGSEIFGALMDEDKDVRYDIDNGQYVFYDGAKDYWERVHEDVARSEQLKKILAEELNADMSEINEKLDEACEGINDLDELESVKRAVLENIYDHWYEKK